MKTSASESNEAQLRRDVALSRRLGADVHLLASITPVDEAVRITARELCDKAELELEVLDQAAFAQPHTSPSLRPRPTASAGCVPRRPTWPR
ncbi:hypothetical protein [Streptomyces microflavus]|uniref:Uncharacterized protein n=1 Tax=Streptomyces microflavus TaxID=1919 RepID=A0ABV1QDX1_STRMI